MKRANAYEEERRRMERFASTIAICASIIAAVRLARDENITRPSPWLTSVIADCVGLAKMILDRIVRQISNVSGGEVSDNLTALQTLLTSAPTPPTIEEEKQKLGVFLAKGPLYTAYPMSAEIIQKVNQFPSTIELSCVGVCSKIQTF